MKIMKIFRSLAAAAVLVSCFAIHAHGAFNDNTINGDLNSDMTVDIDDVKILSDFLINNECTFSGNADINNDGNVNIFDLIKLKRMLISSDGYTGFIKADGNLLVDETGKQYMIKGMAFGNNVWSNPSYPPKTSITLKKAIKNLPIWDLIPLDSILIMDYLNLTATRIHTMKKDLNGLIRI